MSASVLAFGWESDSGPVEAFPSRLIVSHSLTALCGLVPNPAGLVSDLLHSSVDFAKQVLIGLALHMSSLLLSFAKGFQADRGTQWEFADSYCNVTYGAIRQTSRQPR
jgi:hypothetical protein